MKKKAYLRVRATAVTVAEAVVGMGIVTQSIKDNTF
jgi:hypothetical protein